MKTIVHFGKEFLPIIRFGCPKCQCVFDADNRDYIYERDPEEVKEKLRAVSPCPMCGTYCKRELPRSIFIKVGDLKVEVNDE